MMIQRCSQLRVVNYFTKLFFWGLFLTPSVIKAQVQGKVFRDINASGVFDSTATYKEVGLASITVTAYNAAGTAVGTTTTNATGNYTIPSVAGALRIEFTGLASSDYSGPKGTGSNTSIQFVTAPVTAVNFGVNEPDWYWDNTKDPRYVLPCYVNGTTAAGGTDAAIVSTPYSSTGLNSGYTDYDNVPGTGPMPRTDATVAQVGTVWGAAYYKTQKHYYYSTFLKRHCGMADGPGYIYNFDYSGATPTLTGKFNLQGVTPSNGGSAIDLGTVTRTGSADYTLSTDKTLPSRDIDAFGKVAAMSFGDIDMQPNTGYLWAVNCFQKALIRVDVSGNPTSVPANVEQYILSSLSGYPTSSTGILRPWALKFERGKGYLGVIADASISGNDADLRAIVLEFDPNNMAAGFTTKLSFDPNPKRIATGGTWLLFKSWLNTYSESSVIVSGDYRVRAQPVLSDIEFDEKGNMYLSFFDRFGHQMGFYNYLPLSGSTTLVKPTVSGEIDIACKTATGWEIEGTGACYTSTAEFIQDISGDDERESSEGAVALLKGKNQLLQVSIDPHPQGITGSTYWDTQGTNTYNLTTGAISNWYSVYESGEVNAFGKANGLGDVEFITDPQPLEIGNRVWNDTDKDGIQDAGEAGIDGVTVLLFEGTTQVGTTTTANGGQYYFTNANVTGGVKSNTNYEIRIATAQAPLSTLSLTTTNVGSNASDLIDNDGTISGANAVVAFTTGTSGQNNHTYDFGFTTPPCSINLTTNISACYDSNGNTAGGSSVAAVQVIVDWSNNPSGETINVTCTGATAQSINPTTSSKPAILTFIVPADGSSLTITATFSTTTTCTVTQNVTAPAGGCLLTPCQSGNTGGIVWRDFNNNGIQDASETTGIGGVTVKAFDNNGNLVATTTTDYLGQYTFTTLTPSPTNKYRIEFSNIPPQYQPTFNGTNGRTDVQFISAASCTVDLGVNNPVDYCQTNPQLATTCFVNGTPLTIGPAGLESAYAPSLVGVSYSATGPTPTETALSLAGASGAVWGLAYQRESNKLFSAAYLKRHSGWGPLGAGGIYITSDPSSASPTTTSFVSLDALGFPTGGFSRYGLSNDKSQPSTDVAAFTQVAKVGLGDMTISEDGKYLYVTNLYDKKVYRIFINNPVVVPTAADVTSFAVPNPCGNADNRPFALKYYDGKLYAGVICSGETNQDTSGLKATVYQFNPDGTSPIKVLEFSLNYQRGTAWYTIPQGKKWYPWLNDVTKVFEDSGVRLYPQPMLTDIEFDDKGAMLLGFRDRFGDQEGEFNYNLSDTLHVSSSESVAGGDLLRAERIGNSAWILEKNATSGSLTTGGANNGEGPGGGEFYFEDNYLGPYGNHYETALGGLAVKKGSGNVISTNFDPEFPENTNGYNSAGARHYSNTTGQRLNYFTIYNSNNTLSSGTFEKSGGLGDIELLCSPEPLQIGNYVWIDADKDGVQDPNETPLSNITVTLWKGGTQIASTTTDANGEYYFSDKNAPSVTWTGTGVDTTLLPSTAYEVRIAMSQTGITTPNYSLTTANATTNSGNDQNDSDASVVSGSAVITLTTGLAGSTNHTYDFGFQISCITPSAISLMQTAPTCTSATANNDGKITFTSISNADKYFINSGATSTGTYATASAIPASGTDIQTAIPNTGGSYTIRFFNGSNDCYKDTTITVAAVMCYVTTPCLAGSTGGNVWIDTNSNGVIDSAETTGLIGVTVTAYDCNNMVVATTTTDYFGQYTFGTALTYPNKYRIEFSNIPPQYIPTFNGSDGRTDVQFVNSANCTIDFGVMAACVAPVTNQILKPGYSILTCLPGADSIVLAVKDIRQLGTVWDTPANRNVDQSSQVSTGTTWTIDKFGSNKLFGMTVDQRDGTIYVGTSELVGDAQHTGGTILADNVPARIYKIGPVSTTPVLWATLPGQLGVGGIDIDTVNNQIYAVSIDNGSIYRIPLSTGTIAQTYDPLLPDNNSVKSLPPMGDAVWGLGYNHVEKKLYYSVWANNAAFTTSYTNSTTNHNLIRSVAINNDGTISSTDQLEITIPFLTVNFNTNYSEPVSDIEFNAAGNKVLLAESACVFFPDNNTWSTGAHDARLLEYTKSGASWTIEPIPSGNQNSKFDIGLETFYAGKNSRGGAAWAYHDVSNNIIGGDEEFILSTADAMHLPSAGYTDYLYGYQFTPETGGNILNSVLVNFGLVTGSKFTFNDVEIYKGNQCPSALQIGNYVWLDADHDGVQDPCEAPLSNITVTLWKGGTQIASTTTDVNGEYYFSDKNAPSVTWTGTGADTTLLPSTAYEVRILMSQTGISTSSYVLTTANSTTNLGNDQNDSDASVVSGSAVITLTTGLAGSTNHTYDFGFVSCSPPTLTGVSVDTATCTNGVANSNAAVHVVGITGMTKYAYSTNGTTGLYALTATASTASSINLTGLANPSVATTYTFRLWGADTTCYNDTTVILPPSVCPQCSITGTFTQNTCNNNGTAAVMTDDYFTVTVSSVSAINSGTSGKYEVVLNGTTVLNTGGTTYGSSVTVGGAGVFAANGSTTYSLTIRDFDNHTCTTAVFMTTATQNCSTCPTPVCIPVTVTRTN